MRSRASWSSGYAARMKRARENKKAHKTISYASRKSAYVQRLRFSVASMNLPPIVPPAARHRQAPRGVSEFKEIFSLTGETIRPEQASMV